MLEHRDSQVHDPSSAEEETYHWAERQRSGPNGHRAVNAFPFY
jgi:hypothetical protein